MQKLKKSVAEKLELQYEILKNFWVEIKPAIIGRDLKIIRKDRLGKIYRRFVIEIDGRLISLNFDANSLFQKTNSVNVMVICSDLSSEEKQLLVISLSSLTTSKKLEQIFAKSELLKVATRIWARRNRDGLNFKDLCDIPELKTSASTFHRIKTKFKTTPESSKNLTKVQNIDVTATKFRSRNTHQSRRKTRDANQEELF